MSNSKLCTITSYGKIKELGGITAPITRPTKISVDIIIRLINQGITVYEVNPYKRTEKVLLTRENVNSDNFFKTTNVTEKVEEPADTETSEPVTEETKSYSNGKKNKAVKASDF